MTVLSGLGLGLRLRRLFSTAVVIVVLALLGLVNNQHLFGRIHSVVVEHDGHNTSSLLARRLGIVLFSDNNLRYFALVLAFNFIKHHFQRELALESHALLVLVCNVNFTLVQCDLVCLVDKASVEPEVAQVLLRKGSEK